MLTDTTIIGIRALTHLVLLDTSEAVSPRQIAEALDVSPSYLEKILRLFVKADILRARRGAKGGVSLSRPPPDISLLAITETCQGKLLGNYCEDTTRLKHVCAYHRAMAELHDGMIDTLSRWTLAELAESPCPSKAIAAKVRCRMTPTR